MDTLRIGFTGTRQGLTPHQDKRFRELADGLMTHKVKFIHGGCVGADMDAHHLAKAYGWKIFVYPSNIPRQQGEYEDDAYYIFDPKPPLERNKLIVRESHIMFAAPRGHTRELRSGTWATIREAEKKSRITLMLWPTP